MGQGRNNKATVPLGRARPGIGLLMMLAEGKTSRTQYFFVCKVLLMLYLIIDALPVFLVDMLFLIVDAIFSSMLFLLMVWKRDG